MIKILLDDNIRYGDSKDIGRTYLECPEQELVSIGENTTLVGEVVIPSQFVVQGFRIVEERINANGESKVIQEYSIPPDIMYSLFAQLEQFFNND